ncbi:MAG TPA: radical SAM protein [Rhodoblastus sp.]|nr:radical SAM protein [Rhodoblastus sp.]
MRTDAAPSPDLIVANQRLTQWEAYLGIGQVSSFPVSVYFALTDVCNARCAFCSYSPEVAANRRVDLQDIQRADWLKFSKLFLPNGNLSEPLAHPQIAEIFAAVRKLAPFINLSVGTNGSLLNDRVIYAVTGYMKMMYVSINAARKSTYEAIMPPLKWEKTISNLARLRDHKVKLGTHLPEVIASVVANRYNIDELPELPSLLHGLGIEQLRIHILNVQGPISDRTLMAAADTPQATPAASNRSFRALECECEKYGVRLTHTLPAFDETTLPKFDLSPYVFPVGAGAALPTYVGRR